MNKILLIGSGRLATHLAHYYHHLKLAFTPWARRDHKPLPNLNEFTHIHLAISDSALEAFCQQHLQQYKGIIVHFSGALDLPRAIAAHPLMSFTTEVYPSDFYPKIHFVLTGANHLKEAIPGAPNPFTLLAAQDKPLYHALCVLGGNLPLLLWQKMQHGLGALGVPQSASDLYLRQVQENYFRLGFAALTGPLARKDFVTIEKNLSALSGDPYQKIYSSFLEACQ